MPEQRPRPVRSGRSGSGSPQPRKSSASITAQDPNPCAFYSILRRSASINSRAYSNTKCANCHKPSERPRIASAARMPARPRLTSNRLDWLRRSSRLARPMAVRFTFSIACSDAPGPTALNFNEPPSASRKDDVRGSDRGPTRALAQCRVGPFRVAGTKYAIRTPSRDIKLLSHRVFTSISVSIAKPWSAPGASGSGVDIVK